MAIDINIPSQVKNYANLAAFPATGTLKTIFIAEDTNKTYRWTGSAYVEISASQATAWGAITGTLSSQTDLNTALSGKVPTTRTLTINGTTQDLSANRTFTVSTGITIGTTAITSGTNGRFLFDDAGVVSETNGAFWDKVNSRWGIGTITPQSKIDIRRTNAIIQLDEFSVNSASAALFFTTKTSTTFAIAGDGTNTYLNSPTNYINFSVANVEKMRMFANGNFAINTTTDAGFKLDVNGTARVSGLITATQNNIHATHVGANIKGLYIVNNADSVVRAGLQFNGSTAFVELVGRYNNGDAFFRQDGGNGNISFLRSGVEFGRIFGATGNWGINTTTDVASSLLTMESTTKGFLPPRMTTTQKNAIASPATGLMVYDTTLNLISVYNGTTWISL